MQQHRALSHCVHRFTPDHKCLKCGCYQYSIEPLKTTKYATTFHFHLAHYLHSLRKSAAPLADPTPLAEDTQLLLATLCDKFLFTDQTLALGTHLFQSLHTLHPNERFWVSACLIVAGKSGQLDKNVPYLNRYQRYAQKSFTQQQYQQAQRTILESMNFEVQLTTFITFLDFYLTCGVLFTSDAINEPLIQFFEDDVISKAKQFLKKGTFTKYRPQLLALSIIKEIRLKYNLNGWNEHLQELSSYNQDDVVVIGSGESPLKELSHNSINKLVDIKGGVIPRRKYQYATRTDTKPILQKFSSISKSTANTLKQNTYSSSKLLLHTHNHRKPSHHFLTVDPLCSINPDLLSKRR